MSNELIKTAEPSTIAAFMQPRHRQAERDEIARLTKEWEKKNGKVKLIAPKVQPPAKVRLEYYDGAWS